MKDWERNHSRIWIHPSNAKFMKPTPREASKMSEPEEEEGKIIQFIREIVGDILLFLLGAVVFLLIVLLIFGRLLKWLIWDFYF